MLNFIIFIILLSAFFLFLCLIVFENNNSNYNYQYRVDLKKRKKFNKRYYILPEVKPEQTPTTLIKASPVSPDEIKPKRF